MAKRRGHGEGTMFKRKDGLWAGQVTLPNGKRPTVYGATQAEVREKLRALRASTATDLGKLTLAEHMTTWLASVRLRVKPGTFDGYERAAKRVTDELGTIKVGALTAADVRAFLDRQLVAGYAPKKAQEVLHNALATLVEDRRLPTNPAAVDDPRGPAPKTEPLTAEQTRALLDVLEGDLRWGPRIALSVLGLRVGEVLGLMPEDFAHGTVTARRNLKEFTSKKAAEVRALPAAVNARWLIRWLPTTHGAAKSRAKVEGETFALATQKTKASRRTLPVPPRLAAMVAPVLAAAEPGELLFRTRSGGPVSQTSMRRAWRAALEDAGIDYLKLHGARHGAGSLLLEAGVDLAVISAWLGHSDIGVTADTYVTVRSGPLADAAGRMEEAFRKRGP